MIYKPSRLKPNLNELDVNNEEGTDFSCQVNTSGNDVKAYKIQILSQIGETIFDQKAQNLDKNIQNKDILTANFKYSNNSIKVNDGTAQSLGAGQTLTNGKDYQWNIRTYENNAPRTSGQSPQTLVCSGFLVGSTSYVIWTKNNEKIERNRYVEFSTTNTDMFPILPPNTENKTLPDNGVTYRERHKIEWVDTDLGWDKDITKIELDERFEYSYKDGTHFYLYQCSDEHTLTSFYVDPNDDIERGNFVILYKDWETANSMRGKDNPASTNTSYINQRLEKTPRKIIGYGESTGEIRIQEPLTTLPENGNAYLLFTYDAVSKKYTEVISDVSQVIGGTPIYSSGTSGFPIMTNSWTSSLRRLFIQPNINIKTDLTNADQLVIDSDGATFNIALKTDADKATPYIPGKVSDITFNKLDNTQWLLSYPTSNSTITDTTITPGSTYSVYTDFMDSMPNAVIYARATPTITVKYKDLRGSGDYEDIVAKTGEERPTASWRDIEFQGTWNSPSGVETKYYYYNLYYINAYGNRTLITTSEEIYDTTLYWAYKGFAPNTYYNIELCIADQYGGIFTQSYSFQTIYAVKESIVPPATKFICDETAMQLLISAPVLVESIDNGNEKTVDASNITNSNTLSTMDGRIAKYSPMIGSEGFIEIPTNFCFFTKFRFPYDKTSTHNFFETIKGLDQKTLVEVTNQVTDKFYIADNKYLKEAIDNKANREIIYLALMSGATELARGEIKDYDYGGTGIVTLTAALQSPTFNNITYTAFRYTGGYYQPITVTDDDITVYTDKYTVKCGGFDGFIITEDNQVKYNDNYAKMRVYKNDSTTPLKCFGRTSGSSADQAKDYFDFSKNVNDVREATEVSLVLQKTGEGSDSYIYLGSLQALEQAITLANNGGYQDRQKFILGLNVILSTPYKIGVYEYMDSAKNLVYTKPYEYFMIDALSDLNLSNYDEIHVPSELQADSTSTPGAINWADQASDGTDFMWLVDDTTIIEENLLAMSKNWFDFSLMVRDDIVYCDCLVMNS